MALHVKYRPQTFDEIVGHKETVESLKNFVGDEERPQSYLFHGPPGCGKTTLARILSNELGCSETDYVEINASNNRGIDTAREILSNINFKPIKGKIKTVVLDEVHQTTKDFQNALLKVLEEPPKHAYFILCTTDPNKLLPAVKSRCSDFRVSNLQEKSLIRLLMRVAENEEINLDRKVMKLLSKSANGSPRNALIGLDQIKYLSEEDALELLQKEKLKESQILDLCRALITSGTSWNTVANILSNLEEEPETVRRAVLGYMSSVLLKGDNKKAAIVIECFQDNFYDSGKAGLIFACYESFFV